VGLIGFSRTVFSVMTALTQGHNVVTAAAICDGIQAGYLEYMLGAGSTTGSVVQSEYDPMIGAAPFGEGLLKWLRNSPNFNLDKVKAPLMIQAFGADSGLFLWEPYAGLSYLHKPVDFLVLKTDEHVITNPQERLVTQGVNLDWFRFWLQGYEDPEPGKSPQYRRWEALCDMQNAEKTGGTSYCVPTKR
jgi:hypothetical protein